QPMLRLSNTCAFAVNSCPHPRVEPTLSNGLRSDAVDDGERLMLTSASVVFLFQNVYSRCNLLLRTCASNPASSSDERAGLRFALRGWLAVRPGWSDSEVEFRLVNATVAGEKRMREVVAPGCTPLAP